MPEDFPVQDYTIRDEARPRRDGSIERNRLYTFYLGKHGPFNERVPLDNFDESEIDRRIERLTEHLRKFGR